MKSTNSDKKRAVSETAINIVLITGSVFCVSMIFFAIYRIIMNPENINKFLGYSLAFVLIIIFCIFTITRKKELKAQLFFGFFSAIILIYLFEIFFYYLEYTNSKSPFAIAPRIAKEKGIFYDTRTKFQVLEDFRKEGIEAYPGYFGSELISSDGFRTESGKTFPLAGISNMMNVICNEGGEWSVYRSDEHGFNNPLNLFKKEAVDFVLIGGSVLQGSCVKPDEDVGGQLRKMNYKVINMGIGGNGPLIEFATFIEYAEPLRPKIVLWIYSPGDLFDLEYEMKSDILMHYLKDDNFKQNLMLRQKEIDEILKLWLMNREKESNVSSKLGFIILPNTRSFLKNKFRSQIDDNTLPDLENSYYYFEQILSKVKKKASTWNGSLYFVFLESPFINNNELIRREKIISMLNKMDIPFISTYDALKDYPNPSSLFPFGLKDFHYNAKGYALISKIIGENLISKQTSEKQINRSTINDRALMHR